MCSSISTHATSDTDALVKDLRKLAMLAITMNIKIAYEALAALTSKLHELGYRGDYSFEVFNDDYQAMPLESVAKRARQSALWLSEGVLRRSVLLPNQIKLKR